MHFQGAFFQISPKMGNIFLFSLFFPFSFSFFSFSFIFFFFPFIFFYLFPQTCIFYFPPPSGGYILENPWGVECAHQYLLEKVHMGLKLMKCPFKRNFDLKLCRPTHNLFPIIPKKFQVGLTPPSKGITCHIKWGVIKNIVIIHKTRTISFISAKLTIIMICKLLGKE